jgi:outer membrane protein, heavy metal efflux system
MARQRIVVFVAVALLSCARFAAAEPPAARSFSLDDAISAMRRGHPALRGAAAGIRAARSDAVAAGLWTNPVVDASYGRGLRHTQSDRLGATSFGVTQFLEITGAPAARRRAASFQSVAVEQDYSSLALTLSLDVKAAVFALAAAEQRVAVLHDTIQTLDLVRNVVQDRVDAGGAPRYDASRMNVAFALVEADLGDAEGDRAAARGDLDVAVGPAADGLVGGPSVDLLSFTEVGEADALVRFAESHRSDLHAASLRTKGAEASVSATRRAVFQGLGVRLGSAFGSSPGEWDMSLGVTVPLPVVDRGQGAVPAAVARVEQARAEESSLRIALRQRLKAARNEVSKRVAAVRQYQVTAAADGQAMALEARAAYEAGKFSALELSDAVLAVRDTRLRGIELALAAQLAATELERTLGAQLETMR